MDSPGKLLVIAAPSGAGKSSLVKALLEKDPRLALSVSHTTRAPRGQEQDGREYWFTTREAFLAMIARGDFLEHAEVHGNLYGTSRSGIEARLAAGKDVVLEIDWQGALQIKALFPQALMIFVLPPSWDELERRLRGRGEDLPEVIAERLANARTEVAQAGKFDFVIINGGFETALEDLCEIVRRQPSALRHDAQRLAHPQVFKALGLAP